MSCVLAGVPRPYNRRKVLVVPESIHHHTSSNEPDRAANFYAVPCVGISACRADFCLRFFSQSNAKPVTMSVVYPMCSTRSPFRNMGGL